MLHSTFDVAVVYRIEQRATLENLRSNMALHRIGARKAGTRRAAFVSDGTYVDQNLWAIVGRLEWARPGSGGHVRRD
jgi:RimJ/RimL family protein N-acetyltransferase